ncbi:MAG: type II toxin-antitoxin system VapC family toxin [Actinomycetota bacterium]
MLYLDASAIVKLVRNEPETPALVEAIRADPEVVSSALSWTEVVRAARRARVRPTRTTAVLDGIAGVPIDDGILRDAAELAPASLRTLDAIHLASARSFGEDIDVVITYDERMIEAAASLGLTVRSPGVEPK